MGILIKLIAWLASAFIFTSCGSSPVIYIETGNDTEATASEYVSNLLAEHDSDSQTISTSCAAYPIASWVENFEEQNFEELYIHWDDGVTQYGSRIEGNNRVIYAIRDGGAEITQLAVFPPLNVEWGHAEAEWCRPQDIFQFEVIGDWIIISIGEIQGSAHIFHGDIFRVKRDGSGRESFAFMTSNTRFFIIDDWIYHDIRHVQTMDGEGWHRFRPDGTGKEFLGDTIYRIFTFAEDGHIYGEHLTSGRGNLARWEPESNAPITLFLEENVPVFEDYFTHVGYGNIIIVDDYIFFTVFVNGYRKDFDHLSWRIPWATLYTADYRVNKDGSNLTVLQKKQLYSVHLPNFP